mmetsp:Transcript_51512/g.112957  ORF Transcript_51512/g.112957 Transcript_51512/m.112957 type:complete len:207 (-) Transcript_51512:302-922(-)
MVIQPPAHRPRRRGQVDPQNSDGLRLQPHTQARRQGRLQPSNHLLLRHRILELGGQLEGVHRWHVKAKRVAEGVALGGSQVIHLQAQACTGLGAEGLGNFRGGEPGHGRGHDAAGRVDVYLAAQRLVTLTIGAGAGAVSLGGVQGETQPALGRFAGGGLFTALALVRHGAGGSGTGRHGSGGRRRGRAHLAAAAVVVHRLQLRRRK